MSNEHKNIHEFELNLICDFFSSLERQGPGSPQATLKALSYIDPLTEQAQIADLGCGTGGQTRILAQHTPGQITGLDLFPKFIDLFNHQAQATHLDDRVCGVVGSMDNLPFEQASLDLIWSEGAIYNIGFERGLNEWHQYLKPGGYVAISESSWLTDERPAEIHEFWVNAYDQIDTIPNQMAKIYRAGYLPVAAFVLPETCWTKHYFAPQVAVHKRFLEQYPSNKAVEEFIACQRHEAAIYERYKAFYGYTFFVAKKRN